ncbi:MAG: hypothetical protein AAFV43_03280 [Planctomycetota bacterium]
MKTLTLVESRSDFPHNHVGFIQLIREEANLSLSKGKAAFEEFLERRTVQIDIPDDREEGFIRSAWEFGFACKFEA